eukprot:270404_1
MYSQQKQQCQYYQQYYVSQQQQQQQQQQQPQSGMRQHSHSVSGYYPTHQQNHQLPQMRQRAQSHPQQPQQLQRAQRSHSHSNLHQHAQSQSQSQQQQHGLMLNEQLINGQQSQMRNICALSASNLCGYEMNMNAQLEQFANFSTLQLQQALSQYPLWLQKEYMRRIKRQYDEMYVIEDPKIHHWSAICPRKEEQKNQTKNDKKNNDENVVINEQSESEGRLTDDDDEYFSDSASAQMSPSPFSYSPHNPENTTSPKGTHDDGISGAPILSINGASNNTLISPSIAPTTPGRPVTCFMVLEDMTTNDDEEEGNQEDEEEEEE